MTHHKTAPTGAANIFVNEKSEILLMKRSDNSAYFPGAWGLVGGFVDQGERVEEAAKREAQEEIGVEIEVGRFIGRYYNTPNPLYGYVTTLVHYSKILSGTPHPAQPEECSDVRWLTPSEIRGMDLAYDHKQILEDEGLI